jgi:hypothetical protein
MPQDFPLLLSEQKPLTYIQKFIGLTRYWLNFFECYKANITKKLGPLPSPREKTLAPQIALGKTKNVQ